jgi:predicted DNA-binding transcriptional regulator AlpA
LNLNPYRLIFLFFKDLLFGGIMEQQEAEVTKKIDIVSPEVESQLIEINSLAQMLKCSTRHVRRLVDTGRIPRPIKLGALLRWIKADVDRWFIDGCPNCRKGGK